MLVAASGECYIKVVSHHEYSGGCTDVACFSWPAVALAVPGNIVPDFPIINKSFELCYACLDR
ncbi:MAG TPA: hypothetical protein DDX03_09995 [Firmicutes bacterium]|nr:hypothetical protein [Bacillota bacterium]HBG44811.1 hypothetical protein [Bacillota bacterium]